MLTVLREKIHKIAVRCGFIRFTKVKAIIGFLLGLGAFYICAHFYGSRRIGLLFAMGFILPGLFRLDFSKTFNRDSVTLPLRIMWSLICLFVVCIISLDFLDITISSTLETNILILNLLCSLIIFSFLLFITGNSTAAFIVTALILMSMSTINGFVFLFRGKEFCAADILSAGTAANVAAQYTYSIPPHIAFRWLIALLLVFSMFSLPPSRTVTFKARLAYLAVALVSTALLSVSSKDIPVRTWEYEGSGINGFHLNFYLGIRESFAKKPDGYSAAIVEDVAEEYSDIQNFADLPNIIVIMNEAFSDFSVYGNDTLDMSKYMPFISSLEKDTVKGHALSSVFAGTTANSEFEFLLGHTLSFFPNSTSAVPYQQYISSEVACLPLVMNSIGYDSFATHPYHSGNWSRNTLYPLFGFSDSYFVEDYPRGNLVRGYVSDREMYSFVLDKLSSHSSASPLFLFGITMQNHSSYNYSGANYEKTAELEAFPGKYPLSEQYLSLIQHSDHAVEYLLTELEKFPEDTIVLFFGDHMPKIEDEFYVLLNGGTPDTLDEQMLKYTVPFFIWANYDIEEYTLEQTSLNYLAGHLLDAAGIELPPYYQFLRDTEQVIPAINAFGYYSKSQGCMIPLEEAEGEEAEAIRNYRYVQYNNMFDADNRNELFFGQYLPD